MRDSTQALVGLVCPEGPQRGYIAGLLQSAGFVPVDLQTALEAPGAVTRVCVVGPDLADGDLHLWTQGLEMIETAAVKGHQIRGVLLNRTSAVAYTLLDDLAAGRAAVLARWRAVALRIAALGSVMNGVQVGLSDTWPPGAVSHTGLLRQAIRKPCSDSDVRDALLVLLQDVTYMTAETIVLDGGQGLGVIPPAGARLAKVVDHPRRDARDLAGRVVVVVGASSGIGRELAKGLASRGAQLVVSARRADRLNSLVEEIRSDGGRACAVAADAREAEAARLVFDTAVGTFGGLDGLAYASATIHLDDQLLVDQQWKSLFEVNLEAFMTHTAEFTRQRAEHGLTGDSSVLAVSSIDAVRVPSKFAEAYSASKAGMLQCARSLANTLAAKGVRVNVLLPGNFETAMTEWIPDSYQDQWRTYIPAGRLGQPEELVGIVAYLVSGASGHVTGQAVIVDGGFHLDRLTPGGLVT